MTRTIGLYGGALALLALALAWLEHRYLVRTLPGELVLFAVGAIFAGLGLWAGLRLARAPATPFARNDRALAALGISARELEVLEQLAAGRSNKEIARVLAVSPNTVKTHVARLFEKLEVTRRTQAIQRARELSLLP